MLPAGPEPLRRIIRAANMLVQTLGRFAKVCLVDSLGKYQPWKYLINVAVEVHLLDYNTYNALFTVCGEQGWQIREHWDCYFNPGTTVA